MPPSDQLLTPYSATTSVCSNHSLENLHVLVILSQPLVFKVRSAIRNTFGNFPSSAAWTSVNGNWTRMFLVGRPKNEREKALLVREIQVFGDVVVANVPEGYYNYPTLKMLIALKFVSCYCPNAAYFVKTDDDNYINVQLLYHKISRNQKIVDERVSQTDTPIYLGYRGVNVTSRDRKLKWGVRLEEYFFDSYPTYLLGPLNVISISVVKQMSLICPYICIGMNPRKAATNEEPETGFCYNNDQCKMQCGSQLNS